MILHLTATPPPLPHCINIFPSFFICTFLESFTCGLDYRRRPVSQVEPHSKCCIINRADKM